MHPEKIRTKKKILFITHSSENSGGAEDEFERLVKYIYKTDRYELFGIFPKGKREKDYSKYFNSYCIYKTGFLPVVYYKIKDYIWYLKIAPIQFFQLKNFIKENKFDLCILNVSVLFWPLITLKIFQKVKTVIFIRETVKPFILQKIVFKVLNYLADYFISVSEYNRKIFIETTKNLNITTVYSALETDFEFKTISDDELISIFPVKVINLLKNNNNLKIINVGRISHRKNQSLLVESVHYLKKKYNDLNIIVFLVGEVKNSEGYYEKLLAKIKDYDLEDNIIFLGDLNRNILYKLYSFMNINTIVSKSEGFPLVVVESLRFSIPLITTDVGGITEVIVDYYNGLVIEDNYKSLSKAIMEYHENSKLLFEVKSNSLKSYNKYFDFNENMELIEKIFIKIIS